ncbi:hypothetical protein ARMGADRAFT_646376 [Armillaria gallica]|uniref:Uncharacterized protein n=1 Tax=Armillaria gallica TaxID=47427 RepID=A0A2H3E1Q6_ARMGA|nr:hypothetical protein ARMGADRAFT_646376 [Armillaria gallica]
MASRYPTGSNSLGFRRIQYRLKLVVGSVKICACLATASACRCDFPSRTSGIARLFVSSCDEGPTVVDPNYILPCKTYLRSTGTIVDSK